MIEKINHYGKTLSFTDRDGSGFTAQVTLDMPEIVAILNALDSDRFDEVIALAEQYRAAKRVEHLRPPCPWCHDRAKHDPEWQATCDEGMKEQEAREKRAARRADRLDAAARRKEMREDLENSRRALQSIL